MHCRSTVAGLSAPLKQAFATEHGLDFTELLTDGPYKEKYRYEMIRWGEERREADAGFFARKVVAAASAPVMVRTLGPQCRVASFPGNGDSRLLLWV